MYLAYKLYNCTHCAWSLNGIFYSRLKRHLFFKGKAAKNLITFAQLINVRGPLLHLPKESLPRKKASLLANEFATFSITFPVSVPHLQPARCPRDWGTGSSNCIWLQWQFFHQLTAAAATKRRRRRSCTPARRTKYWVPAHPFRIRWFSIRDIPSMPVSTPVCSPAHCSSAALLIRRQSWAKFKCCWLCSSLNDNYTARGTKIMEMQQAQQKMSIENVQSTKWYFAQANC